jgi:hypothetical protein
MRVMPLESVHPSTPFSTPLQATSVPRDAPRLERTDCLTVVIFYDFAHRTVGDESKLCFWRKLHDIWL